MNDLRPKSFTPGVLSIPQAAWYIADCSVSTIERLIKDGELEKRFVKGTIPCVTIESADAYIARLPFTKGARS